MEMWNAPRNGNHSANTDRKSLPQPTTVGAPGPVTNAATSRSSKAITMTATAPHDGASVRDSEIEERLLEFVDSYTAATVRTLLVVDGEVTAAAATLVVDGAVDGSPTAVGEHP